MSAPSGPAFTIHGDLWSWGDLADAVAEARESRWQRAQFTKTGDHDHCDICFWRLTEADDPAVGLGYRFKSRWLCQECYQQFIVTDDRCFICGDLLSGPERVQGCTLHPQRKYRWYHHECYDRACGVID